MAFSADGFSNLTGDNYLSGNVKSYVSTADTLATIAASAYFNDYINQFVVGDIIFVTGSDDYQMYRVTSVTTNVAIVAYQIANIEAGAVELAMLAPGITPSHVVKYSEKVTWSGGLITLAHTITGVVAGDMVQCTIQDAPSEATTFVLGKPTTDTVTLTLSTANTSNDAIIIVTVLRAAS